MSLSPGLSTWFAPGPCRTIARQDICRLTSKVQMRFVLTLLAALVFAAPLSAADIKVIGSPGLRQPYTELVPGFEKSTAHKVTTTWGGVNEVADKVAAGEIADSLD